MTTTHPQHPSDEEIRGDIADWFELQNDRDWVGSLPANQLIPYIRVALAKWGQPAPKVEASEEEIVEAVKHLPRYVSKYASIRETDVVSLIRKMLAERVLPAPYDPAAVERLREAAKELSVASMTHNHFDPTGRSGIGCPACIRLRATRDELNAALSALDASAPASNERRRG